MSSEATGKGLLLKADPIAATFKNEVQTSLAQCQTHPKLVGILATSSAPSRHYAEFTKKQCEELGVKFVLKTTGAAVFSELREGEGVEEAIIEANEDESVHGIMVCVHMICCHRKNLKKRQSIKGVFPDFWRPTGLSILLVPTRTNVMI